MLIKASQNVAEFCDSFYIARLVPWGTWYPSVLVNDDQIRDIIRIAGIDKVLSNISETHET